MDAHAGGPLNNGVASVTVLADMCMEADAWATALMVTGKTAGMTFAKARGLNALFIMRSGSGLEQCPVGPVFASGPDGNRGLLPREGTAMGARARPGSAHRIGDLVAPLEAPPRRGECPRDRLRLRICSGLRQPAK
jgi:ApbE family protein